MNMQKVRKSCLLSHVMDQNFSKFINSLPTCSLELPTMMISCNWKCMCDIFSNGGVFNGVRR